MIAELALAAALASATSSSETGASAAGRLAAAYAEGLKSASLDTLNSAFAPDGSFFSRDANGRLQRQVFSTALPTWVDGPDSTVRFDVQRIENPTDQLASVTGRLRMATRCYQDQLLLMRLAAGWRIVAKTTEQIPCAEASTPRE